MQEIVLKNLIKDYRSNEAYKSLRTNIEFSGADKKVIVFTSCTPNEGKSTVSLSLAASLAEGEKKVLFIDADLRKSVLLGRHKVVGDLKGLSHFLSGQAELKDVITKTQDPNLSVIFAGVVPPNPAELLGNKKFAGLINGARKSYDYVIIDAPPLGSVIDAAIIAKNCDASVLVIEKMNNLAIIPARSGSKGLKDKNIKLLNGKPLIAYSIEAAKKSEIYSHILVSTDSERYGEIAIQYGAEVPFYRSEENASDVASSWDVVKEVLKKYQEMGIVFDTFTLLQPTSPLRKYEDIKKAYELFKEKDAIAVVSVCEMEHSPLWSNTLPENNSLSGFLRADSNKQRQKLETFYRINGAIYMADVKAFLENTNLYREDCYAYKMPAERSIDIDTELDFKIAETIINQ